MIQTSSNNIKVVTLGAGQHVGRSCIIVTLGNKNIMLDCGMHMGFNDEKKFPDFSFLSNKEGEFNIKIDCLIVSHFHLDHCGALPYFTEICGYDGPIIMTYPTKAIVPILLEDYRKIMVDRQGATNFYNSEDIVASISKVTPVNIGETIYIDKTLSITCYYAGHVIGAAIFNIYDTIGGGSVVYTGDYNMTPDRHLGAARVDLSNETLLKINTILSKFNQQPTTEIKPVSGEAASTSADVTPSPTSSSKVDLLITETTYSTKIRDSKASRERDFLQAVHSSVIEGGGKVLIPVFALGRVQELCILIETYWDRIGCKIPVYYSAGLAEKATDYYKLFLQWTNQKIKQTFTTRKFNFFQFKHIKPFNRAYIDNPGPCILFATPGMLHAGMSLEVFKKWCEFPQNAIIFPGHCVKGSIGAKVLDLPEPTPENIAKGLRRVDLPFEPNNNKRKYMEVRCKIFSISFSAHADHKGILQLIHQIKPRNLLLVHGDKERMKFLKEQITNDKGIPCFTPENGETVTIPLIPKMNVLISSNLLMNLGKKRKFEGVLVVKQERNAAKKKRRIEEKILDNSSSISLKDSIPTVLSLNETKQEIISLKKYNLKFKKTFKMASTENSIKKNEKNLKELFEFGILKKLENLENSQNFKPKFEENENGDCEWSLNSLKLTIVKQESLAKLEWCLEDEHIYQSILPELLTLFQ